MASLTIVGSEGALSLTAEDFSTATSDDLLAMLAHLRAPLASYVDVASHFMSAGRHAAYEAVFRAPFAEDWVAGALFWKWGAQGGPADPTFFPLNKSAARVMQQFLGGARP